MSKFTKEMVDDYANKLLIGLTEEENKMVLDEFNIIDKDINIINSIPDIEKIEPMIFPIEKPYELQEDIAENSPDIKDLLKNSKGTMGREIEVPKVVEND
jgi:aspartyl/glutamyl-tRNA(Asn/Gln) amidotransferase C subunit